MKNWFKIIVGIGFSLIAISIFYYFLFYLPSRNILNKEKQQKEYTFEMKQKCSRLGLDFYEREKKENSISTILEPTIYYNPNLNTCLYLGKEINNFTTFEFIKDLFTNENVVFRTVDNKTGEIIGGLQNKEFEAEKLYYLGI